MVFGCLILSVLVRKYTYPTNRAIAITITFVSTGSLLSKAIATSSPPSKALKLIRKPVYNNNVTPFTVILNSNRY